MRDFDPLAPSMIADPYPVYARLRRESPIFWSERLQSWVLTRYADCNTVLTDTGRFASDWRRAGYDDDIPASAISMQELDPPEHTPLRRLFTVALRDQDLPAIEAMAVEDTERVFAKMADHEVFDFTAEIARPVALNAVCRLLGVAPPPVETFAAQSDALVRGMDAGLLPEVREPAMAARGEVNALIASWHTASRLPGLLDTVIEEGARAGIPPEAIWSSARVLFLAAFSTTVGAAANAALALLRHPEALEALGDAALVESGVDELMRFDGPVQGTSRAVVEDTELGGRLIERGQVVLTLFAAANRDPEQFERPDDLVLDRSPNRHLALGWGPHACSGAILARSIIKALVLGLTRAPRRPLPAGEPLRVPRATLRYPDRLPMTFGVQ